MQENGKPLGHDWDAATCTAPKTCKVCAATEGSAKAHSYKAATCTEAKTCINCGAVNGTANGHRWKDADCTHAKTCGLCGLTEGAALGHTGADANCEAPRICTVCKAAEGEALGHDYVKNVCTRCGGKRIGDMDDLVKFLNDNYHTVHIVLGDVTGVTFEVDIKDPVWTAMPAPSCAAGI